MRLPSPRRAAAPLLAATLLAAALPPVAAPAAAQGAGTDFAIGGGPGMLVAGIPQGVGLGLAISRELAEAMDGTQAVDTEVGRGSTFTLTLPRWTPGTT